MDCKFVIQITNLIDVWIFNKIRNVYAFEMRCRNINLNLVDILTVCWNLMTTIYSVQAIKSNSYFAIQSYNTL